MANQNQLVVEVLGDTSKLTASLNQAQAQINKFGKGASNQERGRAVAKAFLGDMPAQADRNIAAIKKQEEELEAVNARMQKFAVGVAAAGLAVNRVGANLSEFGGNVGKVGKAFQDISTGNIVGFVKNLQSINNVNPEKLAKDLLATGDASKALHDAAVFSAVGLEKQAEAARSVADALLAIKSAAAEADVALKLLIASGNEFAAFGERTDRFGRGPGAIADSNALEDASGGTFHAPDGTKKKRGRTGITASQRNTFFDNKITRELDRAQDLPAKLQVKRLQEIRGEIEAQMAKVKDPTRKLTLSDEIAAINREIKSLNEGIAAGLKDKAKTLADAKAKLIQSFKDQADDIKSAVLAAFDTKTDKIHNARDLKDAQKTLRQARQLGGAGSIETAMRGVEDANRAITRQRILDTRFSVGEGPRGPVNAVSVGNITFNITTSDPDKVASVVLKKLQLSNRHGSPQGRGRAPGAWTGLH